MQIALKFTIRQGDYDWKQFNIATTVAQLSLIVSYCW